MTWLTNNQFKLYKLICDVISSNDLDRLIFLFEKEKVDVDFCDYERNTLLMRTALYSASDCLQYLIKKDANINYLNKQGWSAWLFAKRNNDQFCAELLEQSGALINNDIQLLLSLNNIFECVKSRDIKTAAMLIRFGIDAYQKDWMGRTIFDLVDNDKDLDMLYLASQ